MPRPSSPRRSAAGRQHALQAEPGAGVLDLAGVGVADGGHGIGVDDAAFEQVHLAIELQPLARTWISKSGV